MKKSDILWNVLLFSSLMAYFMIMKFLGLHRILSLSYVNLAIHLAIVYFAMHAYRTHIHSKAFSFMDTAMVGVRATLPAITLFSVFQFIYLRFLDPDFLNYIQSVTLMGEYLTPAIIAAGLMATGLVATFFNSYIGMRFIAAQEHAKFPVM